MWSLFPLLGYLLYLHLRYLSARTATFRLFGSMFSDRRLDEPPKQRMRLRRLGFELGMTLDGEEPGMVAQLDHLDELAIGTGAGHFQAVGGELLAVLVV